MANLNNLTDLPEYQYPECQPIPLDHSGNAIAGILFALPPCILFWAGFLCILFRILKGG